MSQDPPAAAIAKLWARAQLARELARVLPSSALARRLLDIANELEAEAAALERQQYPDCEYCLVVAEWSDCHGADFIGRRTSKRNWLG